MHEFIYLIPLSLALGIIGLCLFMWTLKSDQYDDLDGAASRIIDVEDRPVISGIDVEKTLTGTDNRTKSGAPGRYK